MLQLEKAAGDLSRRQAKYELMGMSFREYLQLEGVYDGPIVPLDELLTDHVRLAAAVDSKFKVLPRVDAGVRRETFFYNQVHKDHAVAYTGVGDFVVDGKWTFEVGGKGKGFEQIKDMPNSYVVNDDVSVGGGNKIPLWLFGFLY